MPRTSSHLLWAVRCTEQGTEASIQRQVSWDYVSHKEKLNVQLRGAQTCSTNREDECYSRAVRSGIKPAGIYEELMVRYIIGAAGDRQQAKYGNVQYYALSRRCAACMQHDNLGSFLNNCVGDLKSRRRDIGRHPEPIQRHTEPGEWYRGPRCAIPHRRWCCVEGETECQKVGSACPR